MAELARLASIDVREINALKGQRGEAVHKAGVRTVADLLTHIPRVYVDRTHTVPIAQVPLNEEVTVFGQVKSISTRRPRRTLQITEAVVTDGVSSLKVVWFNQAFRQTTLPPGTEVALSGKVERFGGRLQMKTPGVDILSSSTESLDTARIVPIHPALGKVAPTYIRRAIHNALIRSRPIPDSLPGPIVERVDVAERDWAFQTIHFPEALDEVPRARQRLVFDELFRLEVALAVQKRRQEAQSRGVAHTPSGVLADRFIGGLP